MTPGASWSYYGPSENCTGTAILCAGLLKKAEATGTVVGNNAFTTLAEYLYDAKGRMTESKQTTSGEWGALPVIGLVKYGYNGADQEEEVTYPSGRTVRSCGNEAGQPVSVSGLAGVGIAAKTYATGGLYEADGGLKEITIGALKETRGYNGKRQVESIGLANAGAGVWNLTNYYCATGLNILDCGANNGNVMRQVIQQPKPPSVGGSVTFTVDYGYDGANRLTSVGEALLTDGTQQAYGQTFGYDQYGMRILPETDHRSPSEPIAILR